MGFGLVNNPFGDHMIGVFLEPGFFTREFLEMAFGRLGTTLLQALPKCMMPLAIAFDRLTTEGFPLGVGSHIDDPKINTEGISRFIGCRGGNIKSYSQIEGPFAVDKVCLPLDGIQTSLLISSNPEGFLTVAIFADLLYTFLIFWTRRRKGQCRRQNKSKSCFD